MNRPSLFSPVPFASAAVFSSVLALAGCGGPQWVIHAQAAPDPFLNQRSFSVAPTDFSGYLVGGKTEAEYLSTKKPETQESFQADKVGIDEAFANALVGRSQGAGINVARTAGANGPPFEIRPILQWLEPGYYAGVSAAPAELRMVVRITKPDGTLVDEIEVKERGRGLATGERVRRAAQKLGEDVSAYLTMRVTGGAK